jgi:hypothetical protein
MSSFPTTPQQAADTASKKYVTIVPTRDKRGLVDVEVVPMTKTHATWWDKHVQPVVRKHYRAIDDDTPANQGKEIRADYRWFWPGVFYLTKIHNLSHPSSFKTPSIGLALIVVNKIGQRIPVGMLTVVPRYLCNPENWSRKGYIWFLAAAPDEIYTKYFGKTLLSGVGKALIDSAVVTVMNAKGDGSILLHASPRGGDDLVGYYKKFGFGKMSQKLAPISPVRWLNRSEFMLLPARGAAKLINDNKSYRR